MLVDWTCKNSRNEFGWPCFWQSGWVESIKVYGKAFVWIIRWLDMACLDEFVGWLNWTKFTKPALFLIYHGSFLLYHWFRALEKSFVTTTTTTNNNEEAHLISYRRNYHWGTCTKSVFHECLIVAKSNDSRPPSTRYYYYINGLSVYIVIHGQWQVIYTGTKWMYTATSFEKSSVVFNFFFGQKLIWRGLTKRHTTCIVLDTGQAIWTTEWIIVSGNWIFVREINNSNEKLSYYIPPTRTGQWRFQSYLSHVITLKTWWRMMLVNGFGLGSAVSFC